MAQIIAQVTHIMTRRIEEIGSIRSDRARLHIHHTHVAAAQEHEVVVELTESEPTIQQRLAYEQFWKMFIDRVVRERPGAR